MVNVMSVPNEQTQSRPVARLAQKAERILDAPVLKSLSRRIANLRASGSADKATLPTYQGKTRAVFVGINYYGTDAELKGKIRSRLYLLMMVSGCVSDVYAMSAFLKNTFGFPVNSDVDVLILTDEPKNKNTNLYPTSANILAALAWLIKDAKKDDSLFFHYSGHGGYKRDRNGDEFDRFDETIYPVDYQNQGPLVDDVLFSTLVGPLVAGVRLTAFFDSCHSGTVLDLPYMYNPDGTNIIQAQPAPPSAPCWNPLSLFKLNPREVPIEQRRRHPIVHDSEANVICFSGCKDDEVSIDACGCTFSFSFACNPSSNTMF